MCIKTYGQLQSEKFYTAKRKVLIPAILMLWPCYTIVSVAGHMPQVILAVCSVFIRKGGVISCEVAGARQYSVDFPQRVCRFHLGTKSKT